MLNHTDPVTRKRLAHHFVDFDQQHESQAIGMWAFIASDVLFFGAVIFAFFIYRETYAETFRAACQVLDMWLAAVNTGVLLTSSFTVVLAVRAAHKGSNGGIILWLSATTLLALAFFGIKSFEYYTEYQHNLVPLNGFIFDWHGVGDPGHAKLFFSFYFTMTGIHALHVLIGVGLLLAVIYRTAKGHFGRDYMPIELMGLYWHFVDLVWIFIYPILYLNR